MRLVIASQVLIGVVLFSLLVLQKTDGKSDINLTHRKDGIDNKLVHSDKTLHKQNPIVDRMKLQIRTKLTNKLQALVRRIRSSYQFGSMMIMSKPNTNATVRPIKITATMQPEVLFKSTGEQTRIQILVERGSQPLLGAQVTLNIVAIGGEKQKYSIILKDDGVGADSLQNDGFYSGNISENVIQEPQIYKVDARVKYEKRTIDSDDYSFERIHEVGALRIEANNIPSKKTHTNKIPVKIPKLIDVKNQSARLELPTLNTSIERGTEDNLQRNGDGHKKNNIPEKKTAKNYNRNPIPEIKHVTPVNRKNDTKRLGFYIVTLYNAAFCAWFTILYI